MMPMDSASSLTDPDPALDPALEALLTFLIKGSAPAGLQESVSQNHQYQELISSLSELRQFILSLSEGDLSHALHLKGPLAGNLKNLQSNLRHLTWQAQRIAEGDFGQRVDFMGDFSIAFNEMVSKLEGARQVLQEREIELSKANASLVQEIAERKRAEAAEREQRILAEALRDTATALNSTLDFDKVLEQILKNVERVVPLDTANICLIDNRGVMNFVRFYGYSERGLPEEPYTSENFTLDKAHNLRMIYETGEPMIIPDTQNDPDWIRVPSTSWIRSYAGMPIRVRGKVVGFLNLNSAAPGFYNEDHVQRLRFFADQAAVAIQNARLFSDVNRQMDELVVINRIGQLVTSGIDLEQVLRTLSEQCLLVLPMDAFYVAVYDQESGLLHHPLIYDQGQYSFIHNSRDSQNIPGLGGEVLKLRKTLYVPDLLNPQITKARQVTRPLGRPTRSYVGVPLIVDDRLVGVLSMQSYQPEAYTPEQIRLLETIATQAAIAVEKARLFEQMRQLAITDSLTGLHTRRHFFSLANKEIERTSRFKRPLTAIMLDIDFFKQINDTYGHSAGDQVLQSLARQCLQSVRSIDIVGRYGGEEFVIILPETDLEAGRVVAERLREAVEALEILTPRGSIRLTISLGVAIMQANQTSLEELLDNADQALLHAKRSGRNRVVTSR